jgi:hypothetical protein
MKLEQQVVWLELAKRLKELGVKQESIFYWGLFPRNDGQPARWELDLASHVLAIKDIALLKDKLSAFTVAELGQMLPEAVDTGSSILYLGCDKMDSEWTTKYRGSTKLITHAESLADAMAKLLIYLIENDLWKPEGKAA